LYVHCMNICKGSRRIGCIKVQTSDLMKTRLRQGLACFSQEKKTL
jgi:hypothetical protein